jgi:selT/selW/selH-like putative selenoprotein
MPERRCIHIRFGEPGRHEARAAWLAQELLRALPDAAADVRLVPESTDCFEVGVDGAVVWSLLHEGRLPDLDEILVRVRTALAAGHARPS